MGEKGAGLGWAGMLNRLCPAPQPLWVGLRLCGLALPPGGTEGRRFPFDQSWGDPGP